MKILTVENDVYEIDHVPDEIDDIRFCVFDTTETDWMDYYFLPLIFLESFYAPAICLQIGENSIQMPMDWSIVINPLGRKMLEAEPIQITNIYQDVKWFFPKLKNGHLLVAPLENKPNPRCAFFVKEANKIPSDIDIGDLLD